MEAARWRILCVSVQGAPVTYGAISYAAVASPQLPERRPLAARSLLDLIGSLPSPDEAATSSDGRGVELGDLVAAGRSGLPAGAIAPGG
jgi:hypothetical protein